MKKPIIIFASIVLGFVIFLVARSLGIKGSIEEKISQIIGLPATIESVESGYFFKVYGLKIKNPPGFDDDVMLDISSLMIDKALGEMQLDVKELLIEKSPTGRLNINYLDLAEEDSEKIEKLKLHLDKVRFKDNTKNEEEEYDLDLDKEYDDPGSIADIIDEVVDDTPLPDDDDDTGDDDTGDDDTGDDDTGDDDTGDDDTGDDDTGDDDTGDDDTGDDDTGDDDTGDDDTGDDDDGTKPGWRGGWYE